MDVYEFMSIVNDILSECKSEEDIKSRSEQMQSILLQAEQMSVNYLRAGILN